LSLPWQGLLLDAPYEGCFVSGKYQARVFSVSIVSAAQNETIETTNPLF
jgi:hypothetical protein